MKVKIVAFACFLVVLFVFCEKKDEVPDREDEEINVKAPKAKTSFKGEIVFQSDMDGDSEIYIMTRNRIKKLTDNTWQDEYPKWSPDGEKIAYNANPNGNFDVFVMNADGSHVSRITSSPKDEIEHAWFPDGRKIAFTIEEKKGLRRRYSLWMVSLNTKRTKRIIPEFKGYSGLPNFSPVDPLMGFTGKKTIGWDVFMYDMRKKEIKSLTEGGKACRPHFSPDGEKIAYVSAEADGKGDIWLMNPDGSEKQRLTERDNTSDYFPSWSPDGNFIVFSSSLEHRIDRGNWSLFLINVKTKKVFPLFDSLCRDLFPDWNWH